MSDNGQDYLRPAPSRASCLKAELGTATRTPPLLLQDLIPATEGRAKHPLWSIPRRFWSHQRLEAPTNLVISLAK